jgi:hypothetical protein
MGGCRGKKEPEDGAEEVVRLVGNREVDTTVRMGKRKSLEHDSRSMRRAKWDGVMVDRSP